MANVCQVRIFAPHRGLYSHERWAETLIGRIIAPATQEFRTSLDWYWFTRYLSGREESSGDCDIDSIPAEFEDQRQHVFQSVRFRYAVADCAREAFENRCRTLIEAEGCAISGFLPYSIVGDLGNDDHLEEPRTEERRERRSQLVLANYWSVAKLIIDALAGPEGDGRFRLPFRQDLDLQRKTPFHKIHHIFCNATGIPTYISWRQPVIDRETGEQRMEDFTGRTYF